MWKAAVVEGAMQDSLDMGQPMSENVVLAEMDEQVVIMQVSLMEIEVSSEVILGFVYPSWSRVQTQTPMKNPDGTRIPAVVD